MVGNLIDANWSRLTRSALESQTNVVTVIVMMHLHQSRLESGKCRNSGRGKTTLTTDQTDPGDVLLKAYLNAGRQLGLTQRDLALVIGRDRGIFRRARLDPNSKAAELALLLIRVYRSLHSLLGGDAAALRHWMRTDNRGTGGTPADQVKSVVGLVRVVEYLDGMRQTN